MINGKLDELTILCSEITLPRPLVLVDSVYANKVLKIISEISDIRIIEATEAVPMNYKVKETT